jgi:hypothetical protein
MWVIDIMLSSTEPKPYNMMYLKKCSSLLLIMAVLLTACSKNHNNERESGITSELSLKVTNWLQKQKKQQISLSAEMIAGINPKDGKIEALKSNLDFTGLMTEERDKNLTFIVVPIKNQFKQQYNLEQNSTITLFLIMTKGEIVSGSVIYFTPVSGNSPTVIPPRILCEIFNNKPVGLSGKYRFLTVSGTRQVEIEFRDGKISSIGKIQNQRSNVSDSGGSLSQANGCIDWYLVTTYYYSDGSSYSTEEYLGRTCEGCNGDPTTYQDICPDSGGGMEGGNETVIQKSDETLDEDFNAEAGSGISLAPDDVSPFSRYKQIAYLHDAYITYSPSMSIVTVSQILNTRLREYTSTFIDSYGDPGIRRITLFGHRDTWAWFIVNYLVEITWTCIATGVYTTDARTWTRTWSHVRIKMY